MEALQQVDMAKVVRRFRRATNRRMAVLQDEARREGKVTDVTGGDGDGDRDGEGGASATECAEDDILEVHPFTADMSNAQHHPVVHAMIIYLSSVGIHPTKNP